MSYLIRQPKKEGRNWWNQRYLAVTFSYIFFILFPLHLRKSKNFSLSTTYQTFTMSFPYFLCCTAVAWYIYFSIHYQGINFLEGPKGKPKKKRMINKQTVKFLKELEATCIIISIINILLQRYHGWDPFKLWPYLSTNSNLKLTT